jgi:hypothetical protein
MKKVLFVYAILLSSNVAFSAEYYTYADLDESFVKDVLVIDATDNGCYRFDVHLAITREQQMRGLMFVRDLPAFSGMLFVYTSPDMRGIWMKNTYLSLDILFALDDGEVTSIFQDAETLSLKPMRSTEAVTYVLELNAGTTAALGIGTGSLLILDQPQL